MGNSENISNLLIRDGLSQSQRNNSTPTPGSDDVKLDKRSTGDMLDFIYRYAKYVLYYDDRLGEDGLSSADDWQNFFSGSLPFSYAIIHKFPVDQFQQQYFKIRNRPVIQGTEVSLLISRILAVTIQLNTWHKSLFKTDSQAGLFLTLDTLINSDLTKALYRLIAIANTVELPKYDPLELESNNLWADDISELANNPTWKLTLDKLVAADNSLKRYDAYPRRKIQAVLTALDEVFTIFNKGIQQVQQFAGNQFNDVLAGDQKDAAHLGLLYAFLRLFEKVNAGLNQVAGRHLDFFYKEVLQLKQREFIPDHVHIVIELAKQTSTFLLQKDTLLNAGRLKNKNLDFGLEDDIVVNKAKVASLRTLFKDEESNIYIASIANSADGTGAAFRDPAQNSWPVLGAKEYNDKNSAAGTTPGKKHYPFGATGLMISSPVFLLKEGDRTIKLTITLNKSIADAAFKSAIEIPLYLLNEANLKLLDKAGLGKIFVSLVPPKREAGWSLLLNENDLKLTGDALINAKAIIKTFLFETAYTSEKGWLPFNDPSFEVNSANPNKLVITFKLPAGAPPVLLPDPKILKVEYPVKYPLVRISFNHQARYLLKDTTAFYSELANSIISAIDITVTVNNAKDLLLANDEGPVDGKKTFFPFTSMPKTGSSFYVGNDEAFRKKLDSFNLNLTWEGLPDMPNHLNDYYIGYLQGAGTSINDTKIEEQTLENGAWRTKANGVKLFTNLTNKTSEFTIPATVSDNQPHIHQELPLMPYNNTSVNGYLRYKLQSHFYHMEYPSILAKKLLGVKDGLNKLIDSGGNPKGITQQSTDLVASATNADNFADQLVAPTTASSLTIMATKTQDTKDKSIALNTEAQKLKSFVLPDKPDPNLSLPFPPYTPAIKEISFNYTAHATEQELTLLHLYPFEETNYKLLEAKDEIHLFPLFNDEGTLYVALEEASPGSNVCLFLQLSEFTANPDIPAAEINWQYLSGNEWKILQPVKDVLSDTSIGFQVSGIVTLKLPWDADVDHTLLPSGTCWLKATALKNTAAVCEAIIVAAQGAKAVFINQDNDLSRLAIPLVKGNISATRLPKSDLKKITQDFPSFGGRQPEDQNHFSLRVSERLRHKGRAINVYDYEHIVLEAFPSVFKVKCIPHTKMCLATPEGELLSSPGWVTLAVIPEIKDYPAASRFQPKVSRIILKNIKDYVSARTSTFVQVQVVNPRYQEINFQGNIFLKKEKDLVFYKEKLNQDVRNFLSPWILTSSVDIVFGGTLMMSSVLGFIEKLEYVEYVTDFEMLDNTRSVKGITATLPWSILIAGKQEYELFHQ